MCYVRINNECCIILLSSAISVMAMCTYIYMACNTDTLYNIHSKAHSMHCSLVSSPIIFPAFQCNVEKLGMGVGTRLKLYIVNVLYL